MRKKIVSLFSAAALFITLVCTSFVNVAAAGGVALSLKADKTNAKPGDTVVVTLCLDENPGFLQTLQCYVNYDPSIYELKERDDVVATEDDPDAKYHNRAEDMFLLRGFDLLQLYQEGKQGFRFSTNNANRFTDTGELALLTFTVKENAKNDTKGFWITALEDGTVHRDDGIITPNIAQTENKPLIVEIEAPSDDATLKSLTVSSGTLDPAFSAATEDYTVTLPNGSSVPTVTAAANDTKAEVAITQATSFKTGENKATVTVTAEKGNTKTYTVTFIEINALLSSLKVNGTSVSGFDPHTTSYTIEVPYADWNAERAKTYTIAATAEKEDATVEISDNDFSLESDDHTVNKDKTVTVKVTSQGNENTYTIKFTVLATDHEWELDTINSTAPTCTDPGANISICELCGDEKTDVLDPLGHNDNVEWVTVAATCETDGSRTKTCDRCSTVIATEVIPKTGHNWSRWTKVEGTDDYTRTCSNCNETQTRTVPSDPDHSHDFDSPDCQVEIVKAATCTEEGEKIIWCADTSCAGNIPGVIEATGHTPETTTVPATCTTPGSTTVSCSVCSDTISTEETDPLGHDFGEAWASDASTHWHACSRCDVKDQQESHTENAGAVSGNIKTYSCTVCGRVMRTEPFSASGNDNNNNNNNNNPGNNNQPSGPSADFVGGSAGNSTGVPTPAAPIVVTPTESMTVKVENKITGEMTTVIAKKTANGIYVRLGAENDGCYANVFTTSDEYIYSALIKGGKAEFNIPDNVKIRIVIDSFGYGEDVSSAAAVNDNAANALPNIMICMISVVLLAGTAVMTVFIKKRTNK